MKHRDLFGRDLKIGEERCRRDDAAMGTAVGLGFRLCQASVRLRSLRSQYQATHTLIS